MCKPLHRKGVLSDQSFCPALLTIVWGKFASGPDGGRPGRWVYLEDQSGKVQAPFCTQGWGWVGGVSEGDTARPGQGDSKLELETSLQWASA